VGKILILHQQKCVQECLSSIVGGEIRRKKMIISISGKYGFWKGYSR
jgi:hypothetical protein